MTSTYGKLDQEEKHECSPDDRDTPDGELLDLLIWLVLDALDLEAIVTLLSGFEATPRKVVQNTRHGD